MTRAHDQPAGPRPAASGADWLQDESLRQLFHRVFRHDGTFDSAKLIYKSYAKLTYRLTAGQTEPDSILQVWLLDEPAYAATLSNRYGLAPDCIRRLWPYGSRCVQRNTEFLRRNGVKVPAVRLFDDSRTLIPHAYVVSECVAGQALGQRRGRLDAARAAELEVRVAEALASFHLLERSWPGPLDHPPADVFRADRVCLEQISANVAHASPHGIIARRGRQILERAEELAERFTPRTGFRMAHGDLQLDHLLIDDQEDVWLIDLENMKFFDLEYDACRFDLSLGLTSSVFVAAYGRRVGQALDPVRLAFYELYWLVSWVMFLDKALSDASAAAREPLERLKAAREQALESRLPGLLRRGGPER